MSDLLSPALAVAVPLWIAELRAIGGPTDADYASLPDVGRLLAEKGDLLLYRSSKQEETARVFNEVSRALAVLSFAPGGVTVLGQHWESL